MAPTGGVFLAVALAVASASSAPLSVQATDLNGKNLTIPGGLPSERTLLLVGFKHADHAALDAWRKGLRLSEDDAAWIETPIIGVGNGMVRRMILSGMRSGARTPQARAHLAPAFADPAAVAAELAVDPARPAAVVVDRNGRVLARASGDYDPVKARGLMEALR